MDWKELKAKVEEFGDDRYDEGYKQGREAERKEIHGVDFGMGVFATLIVTGLFALIIAIANAS